MNTAHGVIDSGNNVLAALWLDKYHMYYARDTIVKMTNIVIF